jgi:hypothetical protein
MCAVIVCRHRERMRPKRIGVAPERRLMISASAEGNDDHGGCKRADLFSKTPARGQFRNQPHDGNGDTDERQISVAIGMSLPPHLHNSYCRDQYADKPKPASEQKWESFSVDDRDRRQRDQERSRTGDGQERRKFFGCGKRTARSTGQIN